MARQFRGLFWTTFLMIVAACQPAPTGQGQPASAPPTAVLPPVCTTQRAVVEALYAADDAGDSEKALSYLTDDVAFIGWDEGMNGRHLDQKSAVGKDYIGPYLIQDGLRLTSTREGLAEPLKFEIQAWQQTGNQVFFRLMPQQTRPNGRPYNPYAVEIIFRGCQIELIKVTERITWV